MRSNECAGAPVRLKSVGVPTVRYWAAIGLRVAGRDAAGAQDALRKALTDESLSVRIEAAGVLVAQSDERAALDLLVSNLTGGDEHEALHAARTLQMLGDKGRPALPALRAALPGLKDMFTRWAVTGAIHGLTGSDEPIVKPQPAPKKKPAAKP